MKAHSLTEENYLKALYQLGQNTGLVSMKALSNHLQVSMPTANSMIKKLAIKKLVLHEQYKPIKLTPKGKKNAALIIRKHRLTEMFLVQKMNFTWDQVHEIAEQIEHIQSPIFFNKMDELLGFPSSDPHGSPIPDNEGNVTTNYRTTLSHFSVKDNVILVAVSESNTAFLQYLNSKKINLGLKLTIESVDNFTQATTITFGNENRETLPIEVSQKLLVEKA